MINIDIGSTRYRKDKDSCEDSRGMGEVVWEVEVDSSVC